MEATITIKKSDMEELKKCFEYLREENESLRKQLEPTSLDVDLTEILEVLNLNEEEAQLKKELLAEEVEQTNSNGFHN